MPSSSGRVVIVGGRAGSLAQRLSARGYRCETISRVTQLQRVGPADAVVLATSGRGARAALEAVRRAPQLSRLPVLLDGAQVPPAVARALSVDGTFDSAEALEKLLAASLKARRLTQRDDLVRARLELLLELARERGASLDEVARRVTERLRAVLGAEQVQALELEGQGPRKAFLLDEGARLPVDLAVTPQLRRALESREPVESDAGWIVPLPFDGSGVAALILKRKAPLEREERDFLEALSVALRDAAEREAARDVEARTRASLEAAYVDRYRELIEANNRLKALDRKKNELLAVLTHDLRAPLNVLIGHAHLLLTDKELTASQRTSTEVIQRTSKKVLELVENLLEKSRGEDGRIVLFTRTMDVAETCQETVRDLQILAREKGVALRAEAPLSLPVLGDEQKVRQVMQNLITNALTHAKGARHLVVRARLKTRPDGDVALVEVQDDGVVDDPNDLLLAFERSRGLGLSICRDYVERHGGEIWAEAPQSGGAVFAFTLPIKVEGERKAVEARTDAPLVLLAEDDPVLLRVASMGLSGHYRVETARDGDEVLRRAQALHPDVIVMDTFMPNKDGLEALRELKAGADTRQIPVVLIAGSAEVGDKLRTLDLGAVDTLTKPFALSALLNRVSTAIQRSRARPAMPAGPGNDPETGLFDHLGIVNRLQQEISRSVRYARPLTLAVLKPAMPPGPKVRACVALVRRELRAPDVVGHLGGGVLALLLPETPVEAARPLVNRLCALLEAEQVTYRPRMADVRDTPGDGEAVLEQLLS
ncbi:MAG: hybrid sensor histidine kinase/response regulator [Myxococcota bacterium]